MHALAARLPLVVRRPSVGTVTGSEVFKILVPTKVESLHLAMHTLYSQQSCHESPEGSPWQRSHTRRYGVAHIQAIVTGVHRRSRGCLQCCQHNLLDRLR